MGNNKSRGEPERQARAAIPTLGVGGPCPAPRRGVGPLAVASASPFVVVLPMSTPWRGPHSACLETWGKADG